MGLDRDLDVLCCLFNGIKLDNFSLLLQIVIAFHIEWRNGPEGVSSPPALQMAPACHLHP